MANKKKFFEVGLNIRIGSNGAFQTRSKIEHFLELSIQFDPDAAINSAKVG